RCCRAGRLHGVCHSLPGARGQPHVARRYFRGAGRCPESRSARAVKRTTRSASSEILSYGCASIGMKRSTKTSKTTILLYLLPGVGYLLLFFGLPLLRVVAGSFSSGDPGAPIFSLDAWATLLTTPVYLDGLRFSIWLAIAPTLLSLLISLPLAA